MCLRSVTSTLHQALVRCTLLSSRLALKPVASNGGPRHSDPRLPDAHSCLDRMKSDAIAQISSRE